MSGDWLLFARLYGSGAPQDLPVRPFNRRFTAPRRGSGQTRLPRARPGDGDWAVWSTCRSETVCNVIRYFIPDGTRETIPNDGARQHAPSVTPDGTVYFARSNTEVRRKRQARAPFAQRERDRPVADPER